jgi:hypothetical protein
MKPTTPPHAGFAQSSVNFVITATLEIGVLTLWILGDVADPRVWAYMLPAYLRLLVPPLLGVSVFALSYVLPRESIWRRAVRFLAWGLLMVDVLFVVAVFILGMILMSRK